MAARLWVLSTMEVEGNIVGESDGDGEVEDREEDEEACLVSCEEVDEDEDCLWNACPLSAGEGDRGVGGSEEEREERDRMLEVEL